MFVRHLFMLSASVNHSANSRNHSEVFKYFFSSSKYKIQFSNEERYAPREKYRNEAFNELVQVFLQLIFLSLWPQRNSSHYILAGVLRFHRHINGKIQFVICLSRSTSYLISFCFFFFSSAHSDSS